MRDWLLGLSAFCLLVIHATAQAGEAEALRWLERMAENLHGHSYSGTFILQRGNRIDTVRVVHAAEDGGYRERLEVLTGTEREVVRSVDRHSTAKGARAEVAGGGGTTQSPPAIAGMLLRAGETYRLRSPGYDRIAGMPCYLLHAAAQDDYRYSHRYCVHKRSGLPLLSELIDAEGRLLERMVFTELEFLDVVFEDALTAQGCGARSIEIRALPMSRVEGGEGSGWYFDALPPGFSTIAVTERVFAPGAQPSLHFVLSDGLATVSVYVDKPSPEVDSFEGSTRSGATHAVARTLAGHQLTVVGEVPRKTVEWIARSARYQPGPTPEPAAR